MMKEVIDEKEGRRAFPPFPLALITIPGNPPNIITAALIHVFSFSPFQIGIGIAPSRYSFQLLKSAEDFVVNLPSREVLDQVIFCGNNSGRDVDKFEKTRLTAVPSREGDAPLIAECPVNFECHIIQNIETGDRHWFIGEVKTIHQDVNFNRENLLCYWAGEFRLLGTLLR
ncbi:MAG: flavin reductase family protein [Candidatus Thorarchaeota archaeon]